MAICIVNACYGRVNVLLACPTVITIYAAFHLKSQQAADAPQHYCLPLYLRKLQCRWGLTLK